MLASFTPSPLSWYFSMKEFNLKGANVHYLFKWCFRQIHEDKPSSSRSMKTNRRPADPWRQTVVQQIHEDKPSSSRSMKTNRRPADPWRQTVVQQIHEDKPSSSRSMKTNRRPADPWRQTVVQQIHEDKPSSSRSMKTNRRPDNYPLNWPSQSLIFSIFRAERSLTLFFIKAASIAALAMDIEMFDTVRRVPEIGFPSGPLTKNRFWLATTTVLPLIAWPWPNKLGESRYMRNRTPIVWVPCSLPLPTI